MEGEQVMQPKNKIAVIGAGNIGIALGIGFSKGNSQVMWVRRTREALDSVIENYGGEYISSAENEKLWEAKTWILSVPRGSVITTTETLARKSLEIKKNMNDYILISVATGVELEKISIAWKKLNTNSCPRIYRAMPNIAASIQQSMTCISTHGDANLDSKTEFVLDLFQLVGKSKLIAEEFMDACTVLCGSGVAFFLRMIRASCQGGVQIGFSSADALELCSQTAIGAMSLLSSDVPGNPLFESHIKTNSKKRSMIHPEVLIDQVTTPRGCTIEGLNIMEQEGLHSAIIKGIVASEKKIKTFKND
jgi:pyrroline-5-carboxylate reductase